jgi:hypothetical protein
VSVDYHAILPELILGGTIMLVLVVDLFLPARLKWGSMPIGLLGVLGSLGAVLTLLGDERATFGGAFVVDNFALLFKVFFLAAAVIVLAVSRQYFDRPGYYQGEYYFLLLTSFLGCLLMPSSRDLLMLFISLELVSVERSPFYDEREGFRRQATFQDRKGIDRDDRPLIAVPHVKVRRIVILVVHRDHDAEEPAFRYSGW